MAAHRKNLAEDVAFVGLEEVLAARTRGSNLAGTVAPFAVEEAVVVHRKHLAAATVAFVAVEQRPPTNNWNMRSAAAGVAGRTGWERRERVREHRS